MEFPTGGSYHTWSFQVRIRKGEEFPEANNKKPNIISRSLFLDLEFPSVVTHFRGIALVRSLFFSQNF